MKKLRVWHIPQVPMESFNVDVDSPEEAIKVLKILAYYDMFQYKHRVKPDYCNAQGLLEFDEELNEWVEWYDEEGNDIREYEFILQENKKLKEIVYNQEENTLCEN